MTSTSGVIFATGTARVLRSNPSHQYLQLGVELGLIEGGHGNLSAVVLPVAHRSHDLRGIIRCRAPEVDVTHLQSRPSLNMLGPDDQHAQELAMSAAALRHVLDDVAVVVCSGLVIHLQDLIDTDDGARGVHLDGRQCEHRSLSRHCHPAHADWNTADHTHRAHGIVWPLDGDWDAKDKHAVELQSTFCLLNGRDLTEPIVGALVSGKPDVQDRVLVGVVAHAPVTHRLVELLGECILRDAQVVGKVPQVEPPILPRGVDVVGRASVSPRHPLEAVPEHALASAATYATLPRGLSVLVDILLLLLAAPLLPLTAALRGVRRGTALFLLLAVLVLALSALTITVTVTIALALVPHRAAK